MRTDKNLLDKPMNQPGNIGGVSLGFVDKLGLSGERTLPERCRGTKWGAPLIRICGSAVLLDYGWNRNSGRSRVSDRVGCHTGSGVRLNPESAKMNNE